MPSSREAVLVVSPIIVYSIRRSEPTLPAITVPLLRPDADAEAVVRARLPHPSLNAVERGPTISRAAASARSAWSGWSIGAPKTAMIPSPM